MRVVRFRRLKLKHVVILMLFLVSAVFMYVNFLGQAAMSLGKDSLRSTDRVMFMRKERFERYRKSEPYGIGPGEQGVPVHLEGEEKLLGEKLMRKEAFNIIASGKISLQRAVRDVRDSRQVHVLLYDFYCLSSGD